MKKIHKTLSKGWCLQRQNTEIEQKCSFTTQWSTCDLPNIASDGLRAYAPRSSFELLLPSLSLLNSCSFSPSVTLPLLKQWLVWIVLMRPMRSQYLSSKSDPWDTILIHCVVCTWRDHVNHVISRNDHLKCNAKHRIMFLTWCSCWSFKQIQQFNL